MSEEKDLSKLTRGILSDIIVHMKYAKYIPELKRRENWYELTYRNRQMHIDKFPELEEEIRSAYQFVFDKKVLPSLRSMQFAGKPIQINNTRMFNCCYLPVDDLRAFNEIMFLLLSGTGVGYSVQKHHIEKLPEIKKPNPKNTRRYLIADSIEGWADAIKMLMRSYFNGTSQINFDFSDIRPKGVRLLTSGGKAPGPAPLKECLFKINSILEQKQVNDKLTTLEVHDIICHIADTVLAGGIRRAACICFFSADDEELLSCKSGNWWESNPQRARANNSAVLVRRKIDKEFFLNLWERIKSSGSGEPGIFFTNDKDVLSNPCVEASLKPFSFCNLSEINSSDIETQEELEERAKAGAFIGTLQASYTNFHYLRDIWKKNTEKDSLLGVSMTGLASNKLVNLDVKKAVKVVLEENERVAKLIGINKAARTTLQKPSGTSSLVLGTSSGIHAWHNEHYIRRIRVGKNEAIYSYLKQNHPELVEDEFFRPHDTAVISVPVKAPKGSLTRTESSLDFLERIRKFYSDWIDGGKRSGPNNHSVSATVSIKPNEWDSVGEWMWTNRESYAGLSVLPYFESDHTYKQPPFSDISEEEFEALASKLSEIDLDYVVEIEDNTDLKGELACGSGGCTVT